MVEKPKEKTNKGITLIALVITIIVLLILAGISIATLTGENGVLTKASNAKEKSIEGEEKEQIKLAYNAALTEKLENADNSEITIEELQKELDNLNVDAVASGNKTIKVQFIKTKNSYTVNQNGVFSDSDVGSEPQESVSFTLNGRELVVPESNFTALEGGVYTGFFDWLLNRSEIEGFDTMYFQAIGNRLCFNEKPVYAYVNEKLVMNPDDLGWNWLDDNEQEDLLPFKNRRHNIVKRLQ